MSVNVTFTSSELELVFESFPNVGGMVNIDDGATVSSTVMVTLVEFNAFDVSRIVTVKL